MKLKARRVFSAIIPLDRMRLLLSLAPTINHWCDPDRRRTGNARPFVDMVNPLLTLVKIGAVSLGPSANAAARFFRRPGMRTGFPS